MFVCRECKHHGRVAKFLGGRPDVKVKLVGCQKICEEPAAGLVVNGRIEWFGRLDSAAALKAIGRLVDASGKGPVPAQLEKLRSSKRSGRSPR